MKTEIQINDETWFYTVYQSGDYDGFSIETAFFKTKNKIVTKRKYWLFGEKQEVEVEKTYRDADFVLNFSINNPSFSKEEILKEILQKLQHLKRSEEIKRRQII